jgi:hypothetical protein
MFFIDGATASRPFNPLRTNRVTLREWVLVCRPPLNWNFVKPCSGARRAAWNTTTRCACGLGRQSLAHEPGAAFAERIAVAPVGLVRRKTGASRAAGTRSPVCVTGSAGVRAPSVFDEAVGIYTKFRAIL